MRYLSLFSGIEAASCAWQPLGWELKGVCEIEKFPCNVLKHHYPQVPNIGDITKLTREKLEALGPIDLIVGGSPCLAGDTMVLTHRGWKPLLDVTVYDMLWDGEDWVHHHGVIYKGFKRVMFIDGVWMTPNHLLWWPEKNLWKEAGDWFPNRTLDDRIAQAMMENTFSYLPNEYKTAEHNARGHTIEINHEFSGRTESDVFDILDVGPHNRFMIMTCHGVLLVHNCQGFSVAGKQEGLNDIRSKLAIDYIRVINTVKPRWIVWENVPGVFSTNKGMDFRYFTEVLTRSGYGLCWRVLDAQWFGVSQRRRRVFLVGYFGDWRPAYKVLFESQSLPRYLETLERKREDFTRKTEARTGKTGTAASTGYGRYVETEKAETLRASGGGLGGGSENICYDMAHPVDVIRTYEDGKTPTLEARMGTGGNNIPLVQDRTLYLERQYFATHEGKASTLTRDIYRDPPAVLKEEKDPLCCDVGWLQTYENKAPTQLARQYKDPPIVLNDQGGSQMTVTEDKTATLRAQEHGHQPIVVENEAYRIGSYYSNSMQSDNPNSGIYQTNKSATLQTADPTPACQQGGIAVCSQARVRKLTPTECLRLQGFPDDWFEGVEGYSDTAAYKAIGNSMAVPCMRWIGERIAEVEKEL